MARSAAETTRRAFLGGLAAAAVVAAVPRNAFAALGDIRRLRLDSARSGETVDVVYYRHGRYDPKALRQIDRILRDWRTGEVVRMDRRLIDILSATQYLLGGRTLTVISGYRSRRTNDALRRRSSGVAKNSYHCKGMACDIRVEGVSVAEIERAGRRIGCGGVGIYTRSNFVHIDSGPVRSWGK